MLIDSHVHLNDEDLVGRAEEILSDADSNLLSVINVGYDLPSSILAVEQAERYDGCYAVVGIHPHDSDTADSETYATIKELAQREKVVAIGEIGLDYYYDHSPRDIQKEVFAEQLRLADELRLPVVIHLRDAYKDMLDILEENSEYLNSGILLHCYSGSAEIAKILSDKYDAYFAFGGAITFKNATEKPAIIRSIKRDRILVETDCPYMAPVPLRGTVNEPKNVNLVAKKLAEILDISVEEVEEMTVRNTKNFFKKMK